MEPQEILKIIDPLLNFWVLAALGGTLILVQVFKAALKHYTDKYFPKFDRFSRKVIIFIVAYVIGYNLSMEVLEGAPNAERFALLIGIFNPAVYCFFLLYAEYKKWEGVVAALKMRKR